MEKSINTLIAEEHGRLTILIDELIQSLDSLENAKKVFNQLKWNLEKHFFLEEKAIFAFHDKVDGQEVSDLFDLMEEHGEMIGLLKNIEEDLDEGKTPEVEPLRILLDKHHNFEDDVFYPKLEEMLDENQKQEIRFKISEFLQG